MVAISFRMISMTAACSFWMRRIVTSKPASVGSSFSIGWMMERTFAYRSSAVTARVSSLFLEVSSRVVVSSSRMTSRALPMIWS